MAGDLIVRTRSRGATTGWLELGPMRLACALGRSGRRAGKREGDGASPVGHFQLRRLYYRADRLRRPRSPLATVALRPSDGWCDAAADRNYNRHVRHPYPASAERLWRADHLYDLIVVLDHNERPRARGRGSAIFMHVASPGRRPTEGCIALDRRSLLRVLARIKPRTRLIVTG